MKERKEEEANGMGSDLRRFRATRTTAKTTIGAGKVSRRREKGDENGGDTGEREEKEKVGQESDSILIRLRPRRQRNGSPFPYGARGERESPGGHALCYWGESSL